MSAATALRDHLLPYAGVQQASLLDTQTSARILSDLNRSLQEIFTAQIRDQQGFLIRAPLSVTLEAVTAESTALTFSSYASWMLGCSILITGDARQNRLEKDASGNVVLGRPYLGSTGSSVSATVYNDALTLDIEVEKIFPPIELREGTNIWQVMPLSGPGDLKPELIGGRATWGVSDKQLARPQYCTLESSVQSGASPTTTQRLVLDSLPQSRSTLDFQADLRAPRVTDLSTDSRAYFIPNGYDESILWPWVLYKFSSYPDFIGDAGEAQRGYQEARMNWDRLSENKGYTHQAIPVGVW